MERRIELGLVWQVRTTVSRLSPTGRAVALRVPLLPGEKVVSAGRSVEGGAIDLRLAPDMREISWEGELAPSGELALATRETDTWTERWRLVASPVWNVSFSGLEPIFEHPEGRLVPLWQPWPGESVTVTSPEVGLWLVDRSHIHIADLAVTSVQGFGRLENSTGIVIENVRFKGARASGTTGALKLVRSTGNRIVSSSFEDGSDLLLLQDDSDRNVVAGNRFYDASHSLLSIRCSSRNVIRGNRFDNPGQKAVEIYDCQGVSDAPVRLDDSAQNLLEHNHFAGTAGSGRNYDHNAIQHGGQDSIVRFNLFTNNRGGGVNYSYYPEESMYVHGNRLYNNTFYDNRCYAIIGQSGPSRRFHDNRVLNNALFHNADCRGRAGRQTDIEDGWQVILLENGEYDRDPGFGDAAAGDLTPRADSRLVDAGAFATKASADGEGTELVVDDASWFYDGFGIPGEAGDLVGIEGQASPVRIVHIDYSNDTLILGEPATWRGGAGVHPAWQGAAPDIGAFEYRDPATPPAAELQSTGKLRKRSASGDEFPSTSR